ncbi:MAG TPA: M48 family metalloprotease [Rubrivivax sp.]|nr:M48 family metalloprotease [Rubrivivax sp.]
MTRPPSRPSRWWALALAGALALGPPPLAAQVRLPSLGDADADAFSVGTERGFGEQIMREVRRDPDYLDDPVLLDYVRGIWGRLLKAAQQRGEIPPENASLLAWEVFLVRDRSINAFALPGGFVGVNLGLIAATGSADELAAVMAHELTHVTQRHIARSIANTQRVSMLSLAGLILGMLAASKAGSSDAAQAVIAGTQAASMQGMLNYSRDMEREADRVGFGVLGDAGFAPSGMAAMFERLETASRLNDSGAFPYLRTHPLTVDRISEARARTLQSGPGKAGDPLLHQLMSARARVLMDTSPPNLRKLQDRLADPAALAAMGPTDRLATLYAGGLAAKLLGDPAAAEAAGAQALQQLQAKAQPTAGTRAAEAAFVLLRADALVQHGKPAQALAALAALPAPAAPDAVSRPVLLARGDAALALGRADPPAAAAELQRSSEALRSWVALHPADPLAWELLGQIDEALGRRLRAMRAQAEARAALGDLTGAIDRLRAAQALARGGSANDFIEASVIDARLRQLQNQRRQLQAELRTRPGQPRPDDRDSQD